MTYNASLVLIIQEVRPTVFVGVPRVWEKFKDKIEETLRQTSGIKEVIMGKARVNHVTFVGVVWSCGPRVCRVSDVRPA